MNFSDKITALRKTSGMSQEALAEKLNLSRQAISRWEKGTAMPDATNVLQLSKLFCVTTDYLLNDDYKSDNDLPKTKEIKNAGGKQILAFLVVLEVMIVLMQFMTTVVLQNLFFAALSVVPFLAIVGGVEYAYQKQKNEANSATALFRKQLYQISAWLGLYFPIRVACLMVLAVFSRPYAPLAFEYTVLIVYIATAMCVALSIEEKYLVKNKQE